MNVVLKEADSLHIRLNWTCLYVWKNTTRDDETGELTEKTWTI